MDQEHVAALEQVDERHWAVEADHLGGAIDLHHRETAAGRGDRVALPHVCLLAGHQLIARCLPGRCLDDGRCFAGVVVRLARCGHRAPCDGCVWLSVWMTAVIA
jgi:hypothetical protein